MFDVSIILPVYNASAWLDECLQSVWAQIFSGTLQLSVYDDSSTDSSLSILSKWNIQLQEKGVTMVIGGHKRDSPKGVGFSKNEAIKQSSGKYLCFLDADDVMHKDRVSMQYQAALTRPGYLIGSGFHRDPPNSTERYTRWSNNLTSGQLHTQMYMSHGPTVIMPTWFCSRDVYNNTGGFSQAGKGTPEDLIFFYEHLKTGGGIYRVDMDLLLYRYHPQMTTFSIKEETILSLRMQAIQEDIISKWSSFTIWNAGKQGRRFYRSLSTNNQKKVTSFCDVDEKKISKHHYTYEESNDNPKPKIPIVHFTEAIPPFIICVKMNLTGGGFEENLASLNLVEGKDYYHFN